MPFQYVEPEQLAKVTSSHNIAIAHTLSQAVRVICVKQRRADVVGTAHDQHILTSADPRHDRVEIRREGMAVPVAGIGEYTKQVMRAQAYGHRVAFAAS